MLEVVRVDGCLPPVTLDVGEHFLGRGPLLQITDTKVSRKHAKINITNEGEVEVTALHASPCLVREEGGEWTSLEQNQSKRITQNMEIKFTQNMWHYKFSLGSDKCEEERDDSAKATHSEIQEGSNKSPGTMDSSVEVDSDDDFIKKTFDTEPETSNLTIEPEKSKPITMASPKKRQLPDWLLTLTEQNGISPLRSSPKKRKLDSEDEDIVVQKDSTPATSPKRVKKSSPISTDSSLMSNAASTSKDAPDSGSVGNIQVATKDATDSGSVGNIEDETKDLPSKDFNNVKSPGKKNKFPVLVTPDDFQDSDDDEEKENKAKQKKDTNKVEEASRSSCPHGASCYRKNPVHFKDEAHPGDPDFKDPDEAESDDERPECEFGTDCYRKNPDHKKNFKHSHKPQPKRRVKAKKKAQGDDDLDDSFIDDESEESIDDTDNDEDYEPEINSSQD